ncbi:MAG: hydrogenase 4 subunit B [Betaproteobacteria bacterium]|nr:hydrogenase 4 subunit B [Betaproteobacteria bacterium]
MSIALFQPIDIVLIIIAFWLTLGLLSPFSHRSVGPVTRWVMPASALASGALLAAGLFALAQPPETAILPLGLPGLPFHLRLDPLSAFFLVLEGGSSFGISLYSAGYFQQMKPRQLGILSLEYHLFLASMALIFLADDAYLFMVAWELMALSSYFLVTTDHEVGEIRAAGYLYLLIAHIGALGILLCFGVLHGTHGDYTFDSMRAATQTPFWATVAFLLALFGFGAKAGMLPLHVWLPEAHPAAPSPVSALMSGIMLKTAIYGLLRVTFDLLHIQIWWWGALTLGLGLLSALFGVLFAAVQTDMKRLLAYSSIENIGIILVGVGLTILFHAYDMGLLAALALAATLYHALNHAFFKGLLFLGTGSVLHATGERNLGRLGGLIHRMPWVAVLSLVGVLAMAGLPPLNGFVSEWLMLQAFLLTPSVPHAYLNMMVPIAAGALVLASATAAYVLVKFYGIVFLGQPREPRLEHAHDAGWWERAGLAWLALGCILLGLFPVFVIIALDNVTQSLVAQGLAASASAHGWFFLTPVSPARASYSPVFFLGVVLLVVVLTFLAVRRFYHGRLRRDAPWDCGFPAQNARMQDTAEGFGQPIRQIFEPAFKMTRQLPSAFDEHPHYAVSVADRFWYALYAPIARLAERISGLIGLIQHGRIHLYLLYSFGTLLLLLFFVR